jgi:HK97 family phage major capsid protein
MIKNLSEKRSKLLADARLLMTGETITAETRTKADGMIAEAEVMRGDIERLRSTEPEPEQRSRNTPPRGEVEQTEVTAADDRTYEQRNKASNIALRAFMRNERFEQRDLTIAANGGVMIPVAAVQPVQAQRSAGSIYDIVRKMRTQTGEDVRVPLWDDTSNGFVLDSAGITTTDPSITGVTVKVDGLRSNPILLDNKLVADLDYDLVSDVNAAINQRYLRSVSQAIVQGNTSNFIALSAPSALTTAVTAKIGYADLVALMSALDPAYAIGACWSMSNATLGVVLNIVDGNGRPIFMPFTDGATSGFAGTIFGYPVKIDQFAPAVVTANLSVRFGNHASAYTLREVTPGIVIKQSADRWIELNRLGVVAFARAGGAPTIASTSFSPLLALTVK